MTTLYLRNVPDEVVERLEAMAAEETMSVSALAVRELASATALRARLRDLESLPDLAVPLEDIVTVVREGRDR